MLPEDVRRSVETALGHRIESARSLAGGCIAHATRIDTSGGPFFLKWEQGNGAVLEAEALGLEALAAAGSGLAVPRVVSVRTDEEGLATLILEWLEPGEADPESWSQLGAGLAALHDYSSHRYGFEGDNFIGRLPQMNRWATDWPTFFLERRLVPQIDRARDAGRWEPAWDASFDRLAQRLRDLLPERPQASLLHGDLWSGNVLFTRGGVPAIVDPAVYFGDSDTDLAMTELFGGLAPRFYDAYRSTRPSAPGYEERREIYNLYHLINHLNHFGRSYAGAVGRILDRY